MSNFLEDYVFMQCNEELLSNNDSECLNNQLEELFEYRKLYKLQCSKFLLYKTKFNHTSGTSEKYIIVGDQEFLNLVRNINPENIEVKEIDSLQIDPSSEDSEDWKLIHLDFVSIFYSFPKYTQDKELSYDQLAIECEKLYPINQLYYFEISSFNSIFRILYFFMVEKNYVGDLNEVNDDDDDYLTYLDIIYHRNLAHSFMDLYTLIDSLEGSRNKSKAIMSSGRNPCGCSIESIFKEDKTIRIESRCSSKYYFISNGNYCEHNIRGLRHAIVHGCDKTNNHFTKEEAITIVKEDFKEIIHLMISYIEKELNRR